MTELQTTFGVINLAIVDGRPRLLDLKETLEHFIEHRREVVTRRTRFELREAEAQRELVEGLGMAITEVDLVDQDHPRVAATRTTRAPTLMELPLRGLEEFVRRAGPARGRDRRRATSAATTSSPSARPRPSSRCACRA